MKSGVLIFGHSYSTLVILAAMRVVKGKPVSLIVPAQSALSNTIAFLDAVTRKMYFNVLTSSNDLSLRSTRLSSKATRAKA